jgi:tRNA A37 threonylcarbamoyladenosine modification protein TsaB
MILYIDSTDFNSVTYAIKIDKKVFKKTFKVDPYKAYETLGKLEGFLKLAKYPISNIQYLVCNKGPGSYTGTRVGAAHALAISLALNIPVKFLEKSKFEKDLAKK